MKKKQRKRQQPVEITEQEMRERQFLTIPEAAYILRVSIRTVYYLMRRQEIQSVKMSYKKTVIPKQSLLVMTENMELRNKSLWADDKKSKPKPKAAKPKATSKPLSPIVNKEKQQEGKKSAKQTAKSPSTPAQSVKGSFAEQISGEVYTMAEICAKFNYSYGRFYNLRLRYEIPCAKGYSTKCFPKDVVDRVMAEEAERMGRENSEDWYTCFDIMKLYGLGKTQVRRFAETHGVRIRKAGKHFNQYLKADWEAARQKAEEISSSTKAKRKTK